MATRGVNRSPFKEWIVDEPKSKDFVDPSFKQFDGKFDPVDHFFNFQQKMALETKNEFTWTFLLKYTLRELNKTSTKLVWI